MTDLSAEDLRAFSDCLLQIYGHATAEQFPTRVVGAVGDLVRAEHIRYDELDLAAGRERGVSDSPDGDRIVEALQPAFEHHMDEHPLVQRFQRTRDGRAYTISGQVSRAAFHRTGIYNEFFRHAGLEDQLVACLPTPPTEIVGLAFGRDRRSFRPRDAQLVNLLRPHLIQAYRNAQCVSRLVAEQERAALMLQRSGAALVSLDRDRRIRSCTPAAQAALELHFPEWRRRARTIPPTLLQWVERVTVGRPGEPFAAPREPFAHPAGDSRLEVRLLSDPADDGWTLLLHRSGDEAPGATAAPPDPRVAQLPPRLRKVLDRLLQGDSEKQAADRLKLSRNTVHQYVKMLHVHFGVCSRAELMALCLRPAAG